MKKNPLPNEHAARQTEPNYKTYRRSTSLRGKALPKGVSVIYGIREKAGPRGGKTEIQSFRFKKDLWSVGEVRKWLKEHKFGTKIERAGKETKRKRKNPLNEITLQQKQIMIDQLKILGDLLYERSENPHFLNWLNQERLPEIVILLKYDILDPSFKKDLDFEKTLMLIVKRSRRKKLIHFTDIPFMNDLFNSINQIYRLKNDRDFLNNLDYRKLRKVIDLIDDINYEWTWS